MSERVDREEQQARVTVRPQLTAAGVRLAEDGDTLPPTAELLAELDGPDGEPLTVEAHAACRGHVATWAENPREPSAVDYFCTDPDRFGHRPPRKTTRRRTATGRSGRGRRRSPSKPSEPSREYVKTGNKLSL
ncbi:hypothetical protein [Streptomyces fulvoviolaceus]|uniref:hypothetical protein n=1 Tax=Streptomyces fulvoviolaceus TaxID=285535 RepID=UPI000ABC45C1|nr:hypothetical protein [Streptomyces fulvoviolaceus]